MEKHTTFKYQFTVKENHTAVYLGSGGLPVLSTPAMIGYMEKTAYLMLKGSTELKLSKETTVGIEVNVKHLAPTAVGKEVIVKTTFLESTGKIYTLKAEAFVEGKLIGEGTLKRAVVEPQKFLGKIQSAD